MSIDNLINYPKEIKKKFTICINVDENYFITINTNSYDYEKDDEYKILKKDYNFLKYDSYVRIVQPIKIGDNNYTLSQEPKFLCVLKKETIENIIAIALKSRRLQKRFKENFKNI